MCSAWVWVSAKYQPYDNDGSCCMYMGLKVCSKEARNCVEGDRHAGREVKVWPCKVTGVLLSRC